MTYIHSLKIIMMLCKEHAAENEIHMVLSLPSAFVGFFAQLAASGWSDAGIIIPWVLYQQTGDTTLIQKYYEQMNAYMDKIATDAMMKVCLVTGLEWHRHLRHI